MITKEQIETMKGKCYTSINHSPLCTCLGIGKQLIEIEKEYKEEPSQWQDPNGELYYKYYTKIPKHKIGDEIQVLQYSDGRIEVDDYKGTPIERVRKFEKLKGTYKLKIISDSGSRASKFPLETKGDKWLCCGG